MIYENEQAALNAIEEFKKAYFKLCKEFGVSIEAGDPYTVMHYEAEYRNERGEVHVAVAHFE